MASVAKRKWIKPDGSRGEAWNVRYVDHGGARRSKTFEKKKDADSFCAKMKVEKIERGAGTHISIKTIDQTLLEFMKAQEHRLSDQRIGLGRHRNLEMHVRCIRKHLGRQRMDTITAADVEAFYENMRKSGLSAQTAKTRVGTMRMVCEFAVRRGLLKESPVREVLNELRSVPKARIRTFTQSEVAELLRAVQDRPQSNRARPHQLIRLAVHLATFCGLRWGEVFGLTEKSIDFDRRLILVRTALANRTQIKGPKSAAGVRDVPMPDHVAAMLREWFRDHHRVNAAGVLLSMEKMDGGWAPMCASCFHRAYWRPLLKRAGLLVGGEALRFHALRHFASSWWIMNGIPLTDTAKLMGHRQFDTTLQVYAHPIVEQRHLSLAFDRMSSTLLEHAPAVELMTHH